MSPKTVCLEQHLEGSMHRPQVITCRIYNLGQLT